MNNVVNRSEHFRKSIVWQAQAGPTHCDHQYEIIAHELGAALKRCVKCKRLAEEKEE